MSLQFDPAKNAANIAKHGVSLADGDTVEDSTSRGEQRWQTIGVNSFGELMIVAWTNRGNDVRLISVRKPDPKERRDYETSN